MSPVSIIKGGKCYMELVGYRLVDSNGNTVPLIVSRWSNSTTVSSGWKTIANYLYSYPDCPIEATWFVSGSTQKSYALGMGFVNVWNIRELANNNIKWYVENDPTRYISFTADGFAGRISITSPAGTVTNYLNISDSLNTQSGSSVLGTFVSDVPGVNNPSSQYYFSWFFNGISSTQVYQYLNITYMPRSTGDANNYAIIKSFWEGISPYIPDTDPYYSGGNSDVGGGTGDFDGTSDSIDFPTAPTLSAVDTKFISLYTPSLSELDSLASYMWSSAFDVSTLKKLFADPMDCILGLSIVPVSVPSGAVRGVTVGDIATGINMTVAGTQYVDVDCGTLNVNEFWGAYLDYDPYTKAELYLPFIGTHPLATDDIMGKAIHIKYRIDILSGACIAFVKCGNSVLYSFIGQCSSSIPITGNDWTNVINGVLSVAGSIGTMVATGGASAPMAASTIASTAVNGFKPNIEKSGAMSGTGGMLGIKTPYLILTRPRQALPSEQNKLIGYPSFITKTLEDITGYTEIDSIHLENIPATEKELSELENILKSGVIF